MIKDLYYSDIAHTERPKASSNYETLSCELMNLSAKLNKTLSTEQEKLHIQMLDLIEKRHSLECADMYEQGFCDGIEIMLDYLRINGCKKCKPDL